MRVLCIDISPNKHGEVPPDLKEGEVYDVMREIPTQLGYSLYELKGCYWKYGTFRFIPCSDQENVVLEDVLETVNK